MRSLSTNSTRSRWQWTSASLAVILLVSWWMYSARESEIDSKSLTEWFEDYSNWTSPTGLHTSRCYQVFIELEGDALPFLINLAQTKQTSLDRAYESLVRRLPAYCSQRMPQPRSDSWHLSRLNTALRLIGIIGGQQRWKADEGEPSRKPGIQLALPAIHAAMQIDATRSSAAHAAWFIGPPASVLVPELIEMAAHPDDRGALAALQAFALMGSSASNAVPLLMQISTNESGSRQIHAVQSLGGIGAPAFLSVPVIASLLDTTNPVLRLTAARALAELGVTPESAVSALLAMRRGTNEWAARVAALALWNRDRKDEELRMEIISTLRSDQRGWMASCLRSLGTNARPFADELRRLSNDSNEVWRAQAKVALRRIQIPPL